jgi:signal transduction histidine kinase/DNA-binding NarL/FixJ family response regulator
VRVPCLRVPWLLAPGLLAGLLASRPAGAQIPGAATLGDGTALALLVAALAAVVVALLVRADRALRQKATLADRLEKERERFLAAIESIPDGFVMFDADDRLVVCNARYRDYYAVTGDAIRPGARFQDIIRAGLARGQYPGVRNADAFVRDITAWHRGNNPPMERQLSDGRWLLVTECPTPDGGTVGIRSDITALKSVVADLATARDQAERASRAKTEFLAAMSHEIRTPLNGILATADMLGSDALDPRLQENVHLIRRSGRALLTILNEVLDFARIETGRAQIAAEPAAPVQIVEQVVSLFSATCTQKGIDIAVEAPAPFAVTTDADRLRQIVSNLVGNAVKFTEKGGVTVTVRAAPAEGGAMRLEIAVRDTGIGIAPEDLSRLFQQFSQAEGGLARRFGGTGLGLAISRQLARMMGGDIDVESAKGVGTRFTLRLDLPPADLDAVVADTGAAPSPVPLDSDVLKGVRILVAEDNEVNQIVIEQLLGRFGATFEIVADGFEAVSRARTTPFDLILMDIQMPRMSGIEATCMIRGSPGPNAGTPVVALTANSMPGDHETYLAAGMTDAIAKPIDMGALAAIARRAVGRPIAAAPVATAAPTRPAESTRAFRDLADRVNADPPAGGSERERRSS